jgi:hypothetical protein
MTQTHLQFATHAARCTLAATLCVLFLVPPAFAATGPPTAPASTVPENTLPDAPMPPADPKALQITILEGEGALNNIRQRTAREPIVQVEDENHKPVAGVLILLSIRPGASGAGGDFNGQPTLSLRTDANGRATLKGFHPNKNEGELAIVVVATLLSLRAEAIIHQQNVLGAAEESNSQSQQPNPSNSGPSNSAGNSTGSSTRHRIVKWTLISAGVAGGIVAVVLLTHNSGGNNITVGPNGVGPP